MPLGLVFFGRLLFGLHRGVLWWIGTLSLYQIADGTRACFFLLGQRAAFGYLGLTDLFHKGYHLTEYPSRWTVVATLGLFASTLLLDSEALENASLVIELVLGRLDGTFANLAFLGLAALAFGVV